MEKPDFEQIASFRSDISDHSMFLGFKAGCEHVWNTHVLPLLEENKIMFENGGKLTTKVLQLESENKALREEIEILKDQILEQGELDGN